MSSAALNRRLASILLALGAALALAACGGGDGGGGDSDGGTPGGGDQFTTAGLQATYDVVKEQKGADAELLEVQITTAGTDYQIRDGEQATGLHFDPGSTDPQDVDVQLVGTGSLQDTVFPISDLDPAAIDKMIAEAPGASGADDFEVTVMTLGRNIVSGELSWTINGDGAGRTGIVLEAKPDGSGLASPTGQVPGAGGGTDTGATDTGASTTATPPTSTEDAQKIAQCLQDAAGDPAKVQACVGQ